MDSLTQIFLGATTGMIAGGRKLGNKAALWGAIGGTIPDLDVLFGLIYDPVSYLMIHRGFSHSIFFAPLVAPILAWLTWKWYGSKPSHYATGVSVWFWSLFTHPFLDLFTGYGTQLLNPLSNYGFEINSLFIIDPIYTIILGYFLVRALKKVNSDIYKRLLTKGLVISTLYIGLTVGLKLYSGTVIKKHAVESGIQIQSMMTVPGPFSSLLWRGLIKSDDGFYQTYFSVFDNPLEPLKFEFTEYRDNYPVHFSDSRAVKTLRWFSKGYYLTESDPNSDSIASYDLRFGSIKGWAGDYTSHVFTFYVFTNDDGLVSFEQRPNSVEITRSDLKDLLLRTLSL
jgi:inner membrane protein